MRSQCVDSRAFCSGAGNGDGIAAAAISRPVDGKSAVQKSSFDIAHEILPNHGVRSCFVLLVTSSCTGDGRSVYTRRASMVLGSLHGDVSGVLSP
eukprot:SAG31_NODE_3580_length_4100_cov_8.067483_2_plen_95_part_00